MFNYDEEDEYIIDNLIKPIITDVESIIRDINNSNLHVRYINLLVTKGKDNYIDLTVVDNEYNDVLIYTVFTTKHNKITGKFFIPLDYVINKEAVKNSIIERMLNGLYSTLVSNKIT